jgi:large subunit ribosomal protein L1
MARTHATATFNESIDLCLQLNVDPKHGDQMVRGTCNLPHSLGKKTSIAVLTDDEHKDLAKEADVLVGAAEIQQMKEGKFAFTKLICTQESMPLLKPLAKILGPKGLMPNAKVGTLIKASELEKTIAEAKKG